MILILSHQRAYEADRLVRSVRAHGASVVRVNTGLGESWGSFRVSPDEGARVTIQCDGRSVDLANVTAAFCHQLPPPHGQDSTERLASAAESAFWDAAFEIVPEKAWISSPSSIRLASNKLRQAQWATDCDLSDLVTVAGSPAMTAQELERAGVRSAVAKFLGDAAVAWAAVPDRVPVTRSVPLDVLEKSGDFPPLLLQERIEVSREFRVVVVDDEIFAAASSSRLEGETVDRRVALGEQHLHGFERIENPPAILSGIRQILSLAGLGYCSADVLEDQAGGLHLIDLNTTGAWWWIDDLYEGAITAALTDALICRSEGHRTMQRDRATGQVE